AADPPDGDRVVEEDGARVRWIDSRRLKTGLGEDQHLRVDRHAERREDRRQVTGCPDLLERALPALQAGVQLRHRIGDDCGGIGDGRVSAKERRMNLWGRDKDEAGYPGQTNEYKP